jgi:hypothetical protein
MSRARFNVRRQWSGGRFGRGAVRSGGVNRLESPRRHPLEQLALWCDLPLQRLVLAGAQQLV